jgi:hypothetical protein
VTAADVGAAVTWALAHETNPRNLEAFASALLDANEDLEGANALLVRAVRLSNRSAGAL